MTRISVSHPGPGGQKNVFPVVSGLSVYTPLETIPGSSSPPLLSPPASSSYLLSVFDIFYKYLSKDSAQELKTNLTHRKNSQVQSI